METNKPCLRAQLRSARLGSAQLSTGAMDFNVKKLASDAGVFFTRAVQVSRAIVLAGLAVQESGDVWG